MGKGWGKFKEGRGKALRKGGRRKNPPIPVGLLPFFSSQPPPLSQVREEPPFNRYLLGYPPLGTLLFQIPTPFLQIGLGPYFSNFPVL
jgi:hypothetical protein